MLALSSRDYHTPEYYPKVDQWKIEHLSGQSIVVSNEFHFTFEPTFVMEVVPEVQVEDRVTLHYCGRSVKPHGRSLRKYGNATLAPLVSWASNSGKRYSEAAVQEETHSTSTYDVGFSARWRGVVYKEVLPRGFEWYREVFEVLKSAHPNWDRDVLDHMTCQYFIQCGIIPKRVRQ